VAELDVVGLLALGIGLVGLLATAAAMVRSRGARPLAPFSVLLGAAGLAVTAAMSVLLPPIVFKSPVLWALLAAGALLGLLAGAAVRVRRDPRGVLVQGGAWHLLPASLALVGLQVAALAGSIDGVVVATAAIVACASLAVAASGTLLLRGSAAWIQRGHAAPAVKLGAMAAEPGALAAEPAAVAATPPPAVPARRTPAGVVISCAACASPVSVGWRHCVSCGAALAWR